MVVIDIGAREKSVWVYFTIFIIYSVIGSTIERFMYQISHKRKAMYGIMEGFPLFGFGAYIIALLSRTWIAKLNIVIQFILYGLILCAFEYGFGVWAQAGNEDETQDCGLVDKWDYRGTFLNIDGKTNFRNFILFGFAGIIIAFIHPMLVGAVNRALTPTCAMPPGSEEFKFVI